MAIERLAAVVAVALALAYPAAVRAQDDVVSAAVIVADAEDGELLDRVRGQTSDLAVVVLEHREAAVAADSNDETSARAALRRARAVADELDVRVVIWFDESERSWTVFVAEPEARRLLVREVPRGSRGDPVRGSADREAVALIVRSSLRAIALGESVGDPEPQLAEPEPEPQPADPEPEPVEPEPEPELEPERAARTALHGGLELVATADAATPLWPSARVFAGVRHGAWRVDVGGRAAPFFRVATDARATVDAARFEADATLGWAPLAGTPLWVEVAGRAAWLYRRTRAVASGLSATPDGAVATAIVAPGARYRLGAGLWAVELAVGADFFLATPEFGIENDRGFESLTRLWPVAPRASLAAVFEF